MITIYKGSIIIHKLHNIEGEWYLNITTYYKYGFMRYQKMFMSYKIDVINEQDLITRKKLIETTKKIIKELDYKLKYNG